MTDSIPCRRCGEAGGAMTRLWRTMPGGALAPYAAQHKAPCGPARPETLVMASAIRPGPCAACTRDVIPGDKIARAGETRVFHFECAPAGVVQDEPRSPRAQRSRTFRRQAAY